ncbi:hypothetical protein COCSADRAFT_217670 [Bipolaris sorokiniana ND90Pr]|uniref:Uncharacterized protein n=1 Tax=Cochliobolus sativus (strain ND90Pr / ATCC 201652) TaxID=665912 RepID=M2RUA7_COCSN|nr:uncharacterized protein COCSADRAFT_217670 [Bipolaris sorokiniana ND90Pr]EMD70154.1 hypothetical protein COCSADRAFT_217670 [Bipolaris sorokiniana ND90Pr]
MTLRTSTTRKRHSPIPSPPLSTSTYSSAPSTCSKTCCNNPCIAGPSFFPNKRPKSPTPPFTHYSSISNPYLGPARLRCAPHEYPRQSRNGRVDKGKERVQEGVTTMERGRGGVMILLLVCEKIVIVDARLLLQLSPYPR